MTPWVVAALVVLSFLQLPGRTTFDTKLDLVVDPLAFLGRALHLWNPAASGGELQNQAYGYLFPMGPFFVLGDLAGLPPWVTQRLWCALLLCLAYGGALMVARALRVGTDPTRHVGALAYALAPRMLTEIGPLTAETLAAVMLPWVLLPLIRAQKLGPRKAACLSAVAVLGMGGVNGAVVVMALVLPGLWLLTRRWTWAHARLVAWWCAAVTAAVLWWVLPLVLLGQYSLPFVDYVESATNTTSPTSLFQVLRGTNQWVAYVVQGTPWWPAGFLLVDNPVLMAATGLLAAVALAGLARAGLPERLFLTLGVVTGAVLLTIGYVGVLDSPLSEVVRGLLDGPLAPLRNVHKFEPGLRLPLALALSHAITGRLRRSGNPTSSPVRATRLRWAVGALLVLVAAAPAWLLTLRPGPGWDEIPEHWREATAWLADADASTDADADAHGRTLLVPGTGFAEYTWGRPIDEPVQSLARSPWALRSQIPLGSEGNTRLMDAVEDALADGRGAPGLADFLARSGHRFLLLRNDVERSDVPPVAVLREALARSPGLTRVAEFGPGVSSSAQVDAGLSDVPAIEVYRVDREVPQATAVALEDVATVSGGPESLLPLLDSGLLDPRRPTVLAGDGGAPEGADWLVTDGLRNRERNVGRMRDNLGQTLTADEPPRQVRPALDVLPFDGVEHRTVAVHRGIRGITASSSAAFADSVRGSDLASMPFAALDGDPYTAWQSSTVEGPVGQWLELALDTPRVVTEVGLRVVDDRRVGWPVSRVRITTDAGEVEHEVARGAGEQRFPVVAGLTGRVRVTVLAVAAGRVTGNVGIAELSVPGVEPERALRVPLDVEPAPGQRTAFAFTRGPQPRYACLRVGEAVRCDASLARFGEEPQGLHRLFRTTTPATYGMTGTVLPAGGASPPLVLPGLTVSASTQLAGDPGAAALGAIDGDPATTWIADHTDQRPVLRLAWDRPRDIGGLRLATAAGSGASTPSEVDITTAAGTVRRAVGPDGVVPFAGTTDRLEITVTKVVPGSDGPPGISDLVLDGVPFPAVDRNTAVVVPCGRGPAVRVDGISYETSVSGTVGDVVEHRPLRLTTCPDLAEGLELPAGEHELRTGRTADFLVQDVWLRQVGAPEVQPRSRVVDVVSWTAAHREVRVADGPAAVLAVPENANDGWVATVSGQPLPRTRVDGWQQAWRLPSGPVTVVLEFHPDQSYRTRLLIGALAVVLLLGAALLPSRRHSAGAVRRPVLSTRPADGRWVPWVLAALLVVLGGMAGLVALLACLFLRSLVPRRRRAVSMVLAFGGMAVATGVSVTGRVLGHGQDWAYGTAAQAAVLVALAAVVSARIRWFDRA
ncbi:alpha-(1-_3)-arabinofuranosyltransferase domain-containing protein [Saccharothrix deserti]|uniref:alpha-(1->3)-arabinofuranosyltransferase domain-containing protein n=1 Tax=Saccharothrix deserti TaxID=2593674 RepID=UPI001EE47AA6|nr:alpha-(1->3)-arabinofuranosyltransferase family protein [Saccharothrix deserti]